jgi:hypothetical protein
MLRIFMWFPLCQWKGTISLLYLVITFLYGALDAKHSFCVYPLNVDTCTPAALSIMRCYYNQYEYMIKLVVITSCIMGQREYLQTNYLLGVISIQVILQTVGNPLPLPFSEKIICLHKDTRIQRHQDTTRDAYPCVLHQPPGGTTFSLCNFSCNVL